MQLRFLLRRQRLIFEPAVGHGAAAPGAFGIGGVADAVRRFVPVLAVDALPEGLGEMDVETEAAATAGGAGTGPHVLVDDPAHLDGFESLGIGRAVEAAA